MRLNLLSNCPGGVRSGYVNVDPHAPEGDPHGRVACPLDSLSLCETNEASEIIAAGVLDRFPTHQVDAVLDHWISRLAHGGVLTVSVGDAREAARNFLSGFWNLDSFNAAVHGEQDGPGRSVQCCLTAEVLAGVMESRGLRVLGVKVEGGVAVVSGERP